MPNIAESIALETLSNSIVFMVIPFFYDIISIPFFLENQLCRLKMLSVFPLFKDSVVDDTQQNFNIYID